MIAIRTMKAVVWEEEEVGVEEEGGHSNKH
jgi:hypothetical protein